MTRGRVTGTRERRIRLRRKVGGGNAPRNVPPRALHQRLVPRHREHGDVRVGFGEACAKRFYFGSFCQTSSSDGNRTRSGVRRVAGSARARLFHIFHLPLHRRDPRREFGHRVFFLSVRSFRKRVLVAIHSALYPVSLRIIRNDLRRETHALRRREFPPKLPRRLLHQTHLGADVARRAGARQRAPCTSPADPALSVIRFGA